PRADVDVAQHGRRARREVEVSVVIILHVRRALLVESGIRAGWSAAEVTGLRPAACRVVAGEVDVAQPAAPRICLPADEEEPSALDRGRTEVVGGRIHRRAEVLGCTPRVVRALAVRD